MKNVSKFLTELVFTVLVAGIGSFLLAWVLLMILSSFSVADDARLYVVFVSGILFGLVVGYKLKVLLMEHKKTGRKK